MAEEQTTLSVGALVRGRYAIKSVLDSGSTGVVYLVKDQKEQKPQSNFLVLKEIGVPDQQARYDFTIGGAALKQLRHPALPRVHTLFNDDKRSCVYVVMDYVVGEKLADVPWGHLSWPELRAWCEPLVAALSYLHSQEQPLYHGDLKPANLVRHKSGKITLIDLGYVPQAADERQRNCYRAPEQFTGMLDERSDVYGCGALLYALLSGEEPVDAFSRYERISKKRTDPLVLASKLSVDVPRGLAMVLQRALALDPGERFASVKEFWEAFSPLAMMLNTTRPVPENHDEQALSVSELLTTPLPIARPRVKGITGIPGLRGSGARAPRRRLLAASAMVAAFLLLLLGAGTWAWGAAHSNRAITGRSGTPGISRTLIPGNSLLTPYAGTYTAITGRYTGFYNVYSQNGNLTTQIYATLIIKQQQESQFSGTFASPLLSGSISGQIDHENDVRWTVIDASGNAAMGFAGGLNGISSTKIDTQDSMGGVLSTCKPNQGAQCDMLSGPNNGGSCVLNFVSSAFIAPVPVW